MEPREYDYQVVHVPGPASVHLRTIETLTAFGWEFLGGGTSDEGPVLYFRRDKREAPGGSQS